jgi:hypothetical protein
MMIILPLVYLMFSAPQTANCTSSESSVYPGDTMTLHCDCPNGTTWSAREGGSIIGNGDTVTFDTTGLGFGPFKVFASCVGSDQSTTLALGIKSPAAPPPPAPTARSLCTIAFERDLRRPSRIDNEARACLDDVILNLKQSSDSSLVAVGHSLASEPAAAQRAAQRAVDTKDYIVRAGGIDPSRIRVVVGSLDSKTVEQLLVPSGARPDIEHTRPIDETKVIPIARYRRDY